MDTVKDYNQKIDVLRQMIKSKKNYEKSIDLALDIHAITHSNIVSCNENATYFDILIDGLENNDYSVMPTDKDETIAWHIWHITRIEDLVGNLLIAEKSQIFDDYQGKMNVSVKDTGNAMSDEEIIDFSKNVDIHELFNYRNSVGIRTREILSNLTYEDLKRKTKPENLDKLLTEGGLLADKQSIWLKNFWGRLTISGMILLPLTRHHLMHLTDSYAIKDYIRNYKTQSY